MHLGDLDKIYNEKLQENQKKAQTLSAQKEQEFQANCEKTFKNAESTIKDATQQVTQQILNWSKLMTYLPLLILLSLLGGTLLGSWVMTRYLAQQAQQIHTQQKTLKLLNEKTWGVELYQTKEGKFIILPPDSQIPTDWKCQGKPCLKL